MVEGASGVAASVVKGSAGVGWRALGDAGDGVTGQFLDIDETRDLTLWVPEIRSWPLTSTYAYMQLTLKAAPSGPKSVLKVSSGG